MTERERRLPKWAQNELGSLRAENRRLRDHIEETADPTSDTFAGDYGGVPTLAPRKALGRGTKISFYTTPDTEDWRTRLDVIAYGGWVHIYGGRSLTILPESSNTIRLRSE